MKIVKRENFLKIKGKVLYSNSCGYNFENLNIKLKTIKNGKKPIDWYYDDLTNCYPKNENVYNLRTFVDFIDNYAKNGKNFETALKKIQRYGDYDEEELFLVYEKEDIVKLINKLTKVLKDCK